jgi:TonB-linked SusC/RagA family outer membrane protein
MTISRVDQALLGKAAGVQVKPVSGQPGAAPQIRIRGIGSISASADPLYVVDGFPVDDIQTLNPDDVENIDILKDASATAIYGSRGSNGVILITTKRGKEGRPVLSYNGYYGQQKVLMKPEMMNAQEEARYFYDGVRNRNLDAGNDVSGPANTWKLAVPATVLDVLEGRNNIDVDWLDEIMYTAPMQQQQLTLRGGNKDVKYSLSGEYLDQKGIIRNTDFVRYSIRSNIDANVTKRLTIRMNVNPSFTNVDIVQAAGLTSGPNENVIGSAMAVTPFYPIYDSTGGYYSYNGLAASGNFYHPLALTNEIPHSRKGFRVLSNIISEYKITNDLKFNILLGVNLRSTDESKFRPKLPAFLNDVAYGSDLTSTDYNWLTEYTLNYNKSFGKHNFAALAGYTAQKDRFSTNYIYSDKFPNNLVPTLSAAGNQITAGTSTVSEWSIISYLARFNYNYNSKYYLTASFRTDGSSRFGSERKYGKFPSAAVAWRISEEHFLKGVKNLDELKLRASYGETGNNNIGNYAHLATINYENYALGGVAASGYAAGNLANPLLTWEKQQQFNLGTDVTLYNRRLNLSVDYFRSSNTNLLLNVNVPDITGFSTSLQNIGEVRNTGWEFVVSTVNFKGIFNWSTDFNLSTYANKVVKLGPSGDPIISGGNITMIGQPIGMFYGWLTNGIFKNQAELDAGPIFAPGTASRSHLGDTRFVDVTGADGKPDGIINSLDKTIMGNPYPDFYYGMTNRFEYKKLSFLISLQGSKGAQILNMTRLGANMSTRARTNQLALSNNYWKSPEEPGDGNTPRPNDAPTGNIRGESQQKQLDTGSYLRIYDMTFGYNIGAIQRLKVSAFRVYLNAINPFIFTKNTSFNPDASNSPDALTPGRDLNDYPLAKSLSLGVNLSF